MATTNLISRTLGDILIETGNGTPTHASPKGTMYTDQDSGIKYINLNSSTTWSDMTIVSFGEKYRTATSTLSPSTTGWTELTTNLSLRNSSGITLSGGRLVVGAGLAGKYSIFTSVTFQYNAVSTLYTAGVLVNQAAPATGRTSSTSVSTTRNTGNCSVLTSATLAVNDTISIGVQAGLAGNVNILYQNVLIWRMST
jgi:hypothetical protein